MRPIWTFVKQVEKHLPPAHRIETAGALYALLKRKRKTLEKEKGRRLSADEVAAMLAAEGTPEQVAARYAMPDAANDALVLRYIAAVERRLPEEQARDISAELREAIVGRIEAREEELGRQPDRAEIAAILKGFGHPTIVAARYAGREYLIGPQLYPWFWPAQRMAVGLVVGILLAIAGIEALDAERPLREFIRAAIDTWEMALVTFGIVTMVFVIMERSPGPAVLGAKWDPRQLPADHVRAPKGLFETLFTLAVDVIFILWWVRWIDFPNRVPGEPQGSVGVHLSSAWDVVWWPILGLALLSAAVHAADIVYPAWNRVRAVVSIVGHAAGVVVVSMLLLSGPLVDVVAYDGAEASTGAVGWFIDGPFRWSIVITGIVWAITVGVEAWRLFNAMPDRPRAAAVV